MLFLAAVVVAAISPVTIDVATNDGVHRAVEVIDADATVVQVCARKRDVEGEVCGDVVSDRYGLRAVVDVRDDGDLTYALRVTRFDARTGAPAAVAGGFVVVAVASGGAALFVPVVSEANGDDGATSLTLSLWTVSGAAAIGAGIVGYVAWAEANAVVAE